MLGDDAVVAAAQGDGELPRRTLHELRLPYCPTLFAFWFPTSQILFGFCLLRPGAGAVVSG